jgi:hypothetical protein
MSQPAGTALARLHAALDDLGDALAAADVSRLLAVEPQLGAALDGMIGSEGVHRDDVERAQRALLRCRRLGAGLVTFTRLSLDPDGMQAYTRHSLAARRTEAPCRAEARSAEAGRS